ncbi:MAG: MarR family transcriptional regulator [Saccharospirillaceae bacterium]|nr:MarR family transcriptional regulator [Pseudomonadales bacterium]NRB80639.1 MarR family transcriptional regulator [Saccharospirillaceae bacterium]
MNNNIDQKLENQLCFPLYATSRLVTRLYQPLLEEHNLTYPQYIILLILWEKEGITVGEIGQQALLNSNTLTPILKRMQHSGLITRQQDEDDDERKIFIFLTPSAKQLQQTLACLPSQLISKIDFDANKEKQLKTLLQELMQSLENS